jgi:hypothetical protein
MTGGVSRIELYRVSARDAQILGRKAYCNWLRADAEVLEYWFVPIDDHSIPNEIPPVVTKLSTAASPQGLIRSASGLTIPGTPVIAEARERFFTYKGSEELEALIQAGWNADMRLFHIIPAPHSVVRSLQEHSRSVATAWVVSEVAPFVVACAHDGVAVQILPSRLSVSEAAEAVGAALSDLGLRKLLT